MRRSCSPSSLASFLSQIWSLEYEALSQFEKTVIPGEPVKPAPHMMRGLARPGIQENSGKSNHSGSLLASRSAGFGRDDELRHGLIETVSQFVTSVSSAVFIIAGEKPS